MRESTWRWQGRMSALRGYAGLALFFIVLVAIIAGMALVAALTNADGPQPVSLADLVEGTVGTGRHITVAGLALFDAGYEQTENDKVIASYYLLADEVNGYLVTVKAEEVQTFEQEPARVTLTGMTRPIPSDLRQLIKEDTATFEEVGFVTTLDLYLVAGQEPPSVTGSLSVLVVLFVLALLCLIPLAFPSIVFAPRTIDPLEASAAAPSTEDVPKATGRFLQLKQLEPTPAFGKRTRPFDKAVANIMPLAQRDLLFYIRAVDQGKLYGIITISKHESDWGILLTGENVLAVEPGKLYGWKARWAVRFRYRGRKDKEETLIISFDQASVQARFVDVLRQRGFTVDAQPSMESTL